ncbi:MAG: PASTA domain-containing protein [Muribaculaceae bacterium]|nr:PASTA domain-containing protein [Muribaculaceae bacterium]
MAKKKTNNKSKILFRYGLITLAFVLIAIAIILKLFNTTVIEAGKWNERARRDFSKLDTISPERGNILSDNGNILACNLKVYDIKIDLRHAKVQKRKFIQAQIDSLADSLDLYYPRRKDLHSLSPDSFRKYSWRTKLDKEFAKDPNKRTRALRLVSKGSQYDFECIRKFPYLRDFTGRGYRNPLYTEERNTRIYPYGKMAYRSIGRVNENDRGEFHGFSGLECDLDSLLYGRPGLAKKVTLTSGIGNWVTQPSLRGYDVQTTINIDLQDMLEEELQKTLQECNGEWGTALLMEVETGEIKAIANLDRADDGSYIEALNRAVRGFEPGSVMKPISLMIAFEDGLVKSVNDAIDCSPFQRTTDPHAPTIKNMKQVIEMSSNTGIARVIFRGYAAKPEKFYDRLKEIGFFDPLRSGIAAEQIPVVRRLVEMRGDRRVTMTERHLDLARQAYGYNTLIPPLYTLAIYNAIANKGKFVRPHLTKRLIRDGVDSVLKIDYVRERICSEETADKVRQCLLEPVWGEHGTARMVRDERVKIAGKTGTAYPVPDHGGTYDKSRRRYAFAGFFPYDNPKYSCMALILASSGTSANRTSGQVVKNMAVKMYSRGILDNSASYTGHEKNEAPIVYSPAGESTSNLAKSVKAANVKSVRTTDPRHNISVQAVPDLTGYDASTAIRILERQGINVRLRGSGRVVSQSVAPGSQLRRGSTITLSLHI